jgi:hypothetical protein
VKSTHLPCAEEKHTAKIKHTVNALFAVCQHGADGKILTPSATVGCRQLFAVCQLEAHGKPSIFAVC